MFATGYPGYMYPMMYSVMMFNAGCCLTTTRNKVIDQFVVKLIKLLITDETCDHLGYVYNIINKNIEQKYLLGLWLQKGYQLEE